MGLFSFIKNAGIKVFGIGKTEKEEAVEIAVAESTKGAKLVNAVETLELEVVDLNIELNGDTATVWGEAANQAAKEKVVLVVGNTNGIAAVDDRITVATVATEAQFYTVVNGDSLSKIAQKFYRNAIKYPVIFEANKPMLSHPDKIYPGQVLRIPSLD
ncbi:MAG: peptidoglycan-binding protein LysM [Flavobacteriaceae bacterium]|nr:MAG: peptidoglycan-binding protein LysM [Flavobacteriaceae bacterium]